jgi:arsenite methyltransferase
MSENAASATHKQRVADTFNTIAPSYDEIRFVRVAAARLIELAGIRDGARVLDVATGTGLVAQAAAALAGPGGSVVGIDLAPEMLALARRKLAGAANVTFQPGDAERLDFSDHSFDVVLCASSLFFVPDMLAALREWRRVLVPGGRAGFSSFGPSFHLPLRDLWADRLRQHGVDATPPPTPRLADPAICADLLRQAGFAQVEVSVEQLGYFLPDPAARWAELAVSMEGTPLLRMPPEQRNQIRAEHLAELERLVTPQGIWVDVPVNVAFGC